MTERKQHGLIFQAWGIRAILEGRKTQTRRIAKFKPYRPGGELNLGATTLRAGPYCTGVPDGPWVLRSMGGACWNDRTQPLKCPVGTRGDILYAKETWQDFCPLWGGAWCGHGTKEGIAKEHHPVYRADPEGQWLRPVGFIPWQHSSEEMAAMMKPPDKWRSPMMMPRWAARIVREIVSVRAERLQEITEEDARAEGFPDTDVAGFEAVWDAINKKPGTRWSDSPFVWRIEFSKENVDG